MNPDFLFGLTKGHLVYDEETYPNAFTIGFLHRETRKKWVFEISDRRNDTQSLCLFIEVANRQGCQLVGFNNIGFDYPVLHFIYKTRYAGIGVTDIYDKAMTIIGAYGPAKFAHMVWESQWLIPQIDLYKIHHFDNVSKATSLKVLEFNMRMGSIEDLPFPVGTVLTSDQIDTLIEYMWHDIDATDLFADRTEHHFKLRSDLSKTFDTNMTNMSDVKMGETILVVEMEKRGVKCYEYIGNKKVKKQTLNESIDLAKVIFPYVKFEHPEFQKIKDYLESKVITETKGVFKGLKATIDGVDYKIGTGGLHASVDSQVIETDDKDQIVDVDVASFYPNLGIENGMYPAHLGVEFCDAYAGVYKTRGTFKKGSPENAAFKMALVGAYGGSNNKYSPFFDSFYTMQITINGQLLLCMLIEQLIKTPGLRMIQANTDGVTYTCPHEHLDHTRTICKWWEDLTKLELEEVLYNRMFIRDVNSYIAEKQDGDLKRIGAYAHVTADEDAGTRELPHHKDWSARVVPLAAEAALVRGEDIGTFIRGHSDVFDFFLRTKVPRSSILEWGGDQVSNIVRYYIAYEGEKLEKVMPPKGVPGAFKRANKLTDEYYNNVLAEQGVVIQYLDGLDDDQLRELADSIQWDERIHTKNKSVYGENRVGIQTGYKVDICNDLDEHVLARIEDNINYEWYIKECEKIVKPLLKR